MNFRSIKEETIILGAFSRRSIQNCLMQHMVAISLNFFFPLTCQDCQGRITEMIYTYNKILSYLFSLFKCT